MNFLLVFWQKINIFNKDFFKKSLYAHFFWMFVIVFIGLFILRVGLGFFTNHQEYQKVPSVLGMQSTSAIEVLENNNLTPFISDSIFLNNQPPGTIVKQIPQAGEMVKVDRNIYLVVNRSRPPFVFMPNVKGMTLTTAYTILKNSNLKIGDTVYKNDIAKNVIIEQYYNNNVVEPGTQVPFGAYIKLVIGNGSNSEEKVLSVPNLLNKTYAEALLIAQTQNIRLVIKNTSSNYNLNTAVVIKQQPTDLDEQGNINNIIEGENIAIWLK